MDTGSIWNFYDRAASSASVVLQQDHFTVEDVLLHESVLQDVKCNREDVIKYFCRGDVLLQLIQYVIAAEPLLDTFFPQDELLNTTSKSSSSSTSSSSSSENSYQVLLTHVNSNKGMIAKSLDLQHHLRPEYGRVITQNDAAPHLKLPYLASEILSSSQAITDTLLSDPHYLHHLFRFLRCNPPPLAPSCVGYFRRVVSTLIARNPAYTIQFIAQNGLLPYFVVHLNCFSILELIITIGWDDGIFNGQRGHSLEQARVLVPLLFATLQPNFTLGDIPPAIPVFENNAILAGDTSIPPTFAPGELQPDLSAQQLSSYHHDLALHSCRVLVDLIIKCPYTIPVHWLLRPTNVDTLLSLAFSAHENHAICAISVLILLCQSVRSSYKQEEQNQVRLLLFLQYLRSAKCDLALTHALTQEMFARQAMSGNVPFPIQTVLSSAIPADAARLAADAMAAPPANTFTYDPEHPDVQLDTTNATRLQSPEISMDTRYWWEICDETKVPQTIRQQLLKAYGADSVDSSTQKGAAAAAAAVVSHSKVQLTESNIPRFLTIDGASPQLIVGDYSYQPFTQSWFKKINAYDKAVDCGLAHCTHDFFLTGTAPKSIVSHEEHAKIYNIATQRSYIWLSEKVDFAPLHGPIDPLETTIDLYCTQNDISVPTPLLPRRSRGNIKTAQLFGFASDISGSLARLLQPIPDVTMDMVEPLYISLDHIRVNPNLSAVALFLMSKQLIAPLRLPNTYIIDVCFRHFPQFLNLASYHYPYIPNFILPAVSYGQASELPDTVPNKKATKRSPRTTTPQQTAPPVSPPATPDDPYVTIPSVSSVVTGPTRYFSPQAVAQYKKAQTNPDTTPRVVETLPLLSDISIKTIELLSVLVSDLPTYQLSMLKESHFVQRLVEFCLMFPWHPLLHSVIETIISHLIRHPRSCHVLHLCSQETRFLETCRMIYIANLQFVQASSARGFCIDLNLARQLYDISIYDSLTLRLADLREDDELLTGKTQQPVDYTTIQNMSNNELQALIQRSDFPPINIELFNPKVIQYMSLTRLQMKQLRQLLHPQCNNNNNNGNNTVLQSQTTTTSASTSATTTSTTTTTTPSTTNSKPQASKPQPPIISPICPDIFASTVATAVANTTIHGEFFTQAVPIPAQSFPISFTIVNPMHDAFSQPDVCHIDPLIDIYPVQFTDIRHYTPSQREKLRNHTLFDRFSVQALCTKQYSAGCIAFIHRILVQLRAVLVDKIFLHKLQALHQHKHNNNNNNNNNNTTGGTTSTDHPQTTTKTTTTQGSSSEDAATLASAEIIKSILNRYASLARTFRIASSPNVFSRAHISDSSHLQASANSALNVLSARTVDISRIYGMTDHTTEETSAQYLPNGRIPLCPSANDLIVGPADAVILGVHEQALLSNSNPAGPNMHLPILEPEGFQHALAQTLYLADVPVHPVHLHEANSFFNAPDITAAALQDTAAASVPAAPSSGHVSPAFAPSRSPRPFAASLSSPVLGSVGHLQDPSLLSASFLLDPSTDPDNLNQFSVGAPAGGVKSGSDPASPKAALSPTGSHSRANTFSRGTEYEAVLAANQHSRQDTGDVGDIFAVGSPAERRRHLIATRQAQDIAKQQQLEHQHQSPQQIPQQLQQLPTSPPAVTQVELFAAANPLEYLGVDDDDDIGHLDIGSSSEDEDHTQTNNITNAAAAPPQDASHTDDTTTSKNSSSRNNDDDAFIQGPAWF